MSKRIWNETGVKLFRFKDLEIWKKAIEIGDKLSDIADNLEKQKLYRFAEQVRGAGLSISNNISQGSESFSDKEFAQFLNIARRSTFENANMIIVFERWGLVDNKTKNDLLNDLEEECKMITGFIRYLKNSSMLQAPCYLSCTPYSLLPAPGNHILLKKLIELYDVWYSN